MKSVRRWFSLPLLLAAAACGTVSDWQEVKSAPMPVGEAYEALIRAANSRGYAPDVPNCDRGDGKWQSRWRQRIQDDRHPGRYRLRAEILLDEGSPQQGWPIRFVIEQQKVKDLRRSLDPTEDDWSSDGQDQEAEAIFAEMLTRRISPKV